MISAPAQGALALEVREDQKELQKMLDVFCDEETMNEVCAERKFLRTNGRQLSYSGRCQMSKDRSRV